MESILKTDDLSKEYISAGEKTEVLKNISLSINKSEFVVIAGSSGSGKSTLLSILSGLDTVSSGRVIMAGRDITELTEDQLGQVRNQLTGFVFQAFHLIPSLSALENVMFPAELNKDRGARQKGSALLDRVGLLHRQNNFPTQLSGGEQQRVAICRALINEPQIIFADEPTGNLDKKNSDNIIKLLLDLHDDKKTTLVMATHSRSLAFHADRIIQLNDGRVVEEIRVGP